MNQPEQKMNTALTNRIMRRVYFIRGIRMILNPLFLKALIVLALVYRSTAYVSYANVVANAPTLSNVPQIFTFLRGAVSHTETATLGLLFTVCAVLVWLAVDLVHKRQHFYV